MKSGPIIIVEDDIDDKDIIKEALNDLKIKNKISGSIDVIMHSII